MLNETRIRRMLACVPRDSSLFDPAGIGTGKPDLYWEVALSADIEAKLVYAYLDRGAPLPPDLCEPWMVRLHDYMSGFNPDDLDMWQIAGLNRNASMFVSLLKAYLLTPEKSYREISEFLRMPEPFVSGFHDLYFNVRGRLEEPMFISRLLYPMGRQPEFGREHARNVSWEQVLLRCAFNKDFETMYYLMGIHQKPKSYSLEEAQPLLENMIMTNAVMAGEYLGGMQQRESVGFINAKNLLSSARLGGTANESMTDPLLGGEDVARGIKDDLFDV